MPEIGRIQSTNFQALLTELGITRSNIPFALRSEVTPVVLVGGTVSFLASPTPAYRVADVFTNGVLNNPAAGAVLCDTGPLPIGDYTIHFIMRATGVNNYTWEWRDAGNAADLWSQTFSLDPSFDDIIELNFRLSIENDNERFRVIIQALIAGSYQGTILART